MVEIWKDIEGYEGKYQVSNYGRVKSLNYNKEKILKIGDNSKGYKIVTLCKDGKSKTYFVHRLVAFAFIPNPNNLPQVNHKDEDPSNNCVNNLEWCSAEYNINYGKHNEKVSKARKGYKHSEESKKKISEAKKGKNNPMATKVYCVELDMYFDTVTEGAEYVGCYQSAISGVLIGKYKTAGGYHWIYAEDKYTIPKGFEKSNSTLKLPLK